MSLAALVLLAFPATTPCAAQSSGSGTVSGAVAIDAMAQAMRARGLTPSPESGRSIEDYISTRVGTSNRHVSLWIGPDGHIIPTPEWQTYHPNYCKQRARYMAKAGKMLDFEIYRNTERHDGATRNQLTVFARLRDVKTKITVEQREGEATNITGEQLASEGYTADALEAAFAKMGSQPKAPESPCGDVRVKHVQGEKVGDPFIFQAGFQGSYGRYLNYTWDFGDGSAPVSSGKRARHVYDKEGTYEVSVRVDGENIEPGTGTVRVNVGKRIELCNTEMMMAAVHPRAQTLTPQERAVLSRDLARDLILLPAEEYEQESEAQAGLHPAQGHIEISGLVSDGGLGCADPLGTNPTLEVATGSPEEKRQAAQKMGRQMAERMKNLSREEMRRLMQRRSQGGLAALMQPDAESASDALILMYSPNGFNWQAGVPAAPRIGHFPPSAVRHEGIGGWHSNAAAGIALRLSGTPPRELREDSTYTTQLVRLNTAPPAEETMPIYSRWQGEERKATCDRAAGDWQFEGWAEQLMAGPMKGTVTVEEVTGAEVRGTFELSGTGVLFRQEYAFDQNSRGELCDTKWLLSTDGPWDFGMKAVSRGPIQISGTFSAPASVETTRSRFIQHTATVQ